MLWCSMHRFASIYPLSIRKKTKSILHDNSIILIFMLRQTWIVGVGMLATAFFAYRGKELTAKWIYIAQLMTAFVLCTIAAIFDQIDSKDHMSISWIPAVIWLQVRARRGY